MKNLILIIVVILLWSCNNKRKEENTTDIIATISPSVKITYAEIDNLMSQKIYDELNEIYYVRKVALDRVLRSKLIEIEAEKKNLNTSQYLDQTINKYLTEVNIDNFISENSFVKSLPKIKGAEMKYGYKASEDRKELYEKLYYEFLYNKLTDSLMQVNKVIINLKPPRSPKINMNSILAFYTGNLNSDITLWIVSDPECSVCKEIDPKYNSIINKYKDKIKIAYVPYSSEVNASMKLAYYANENELFWEFREYLQNLPENTYNMDIKTAMIDLGLTQVLIEDVLSDEKIYNKLYSNIETLNDMGFYGTPTLLINGRFVDPFDLEEIERLINKLLNN